MPRQLCACRLAGQSEGPVGEETGTLPQDTTPLAPSPGHLSSGQHLSSSEAQHHWMDQRGARLIPPGREEPDVETEPLGGSVTHPRSHS